MANNRLEKDNSNFRCLLLFCCGPALTNDDHRARLNGLIEG